MSSGIKKRSGSDYSDGRPGRINYHSEDEYRTITLTVQATAEDMHDITHLRDAINELFDGELMLREMRIKSVEVGYESPGQRTGEMQLESPEYVNGKQIKVAMVNSPEIDDTMLVSTFTVEFETTESPYFETIYTTLELHDSGYTATAEKYGLVDNIDDEKVQYRFEPDFETVDLRANLFEHGSIILSNGQNNDADQKFGRSKNMHSVNEGDLYRLSAVEMSGTVRYIRVFHYDSSGAKVGESVLTDLMGNGSNAVEFTAEGSSIRLLLYPEGDATVNINGIGTLTKITLSTPSNTSTFTVYNAGNVTVEPESMLLHIFVVSTMGDYITIKNNTTGETFTLNRRMNARHIQVNGMVVTDGTTQVFRDTNKRFISLAPGDNNITVTGATFSEIRFNFKYLYK